MIPPPDYEIRRDAADAVFITGNRAVSLPHDLRLVEREAAALLKDTKVRAVFMGGAEGIDTLMLQVLKAFKTRFHLEYPALIAVCPCTRMELREEPRRAVEVCADIVVELENRITSDNKYLAFHLRNEYMVNHSSRGIGFWNEDKRSGTYSCMSYARLDGKPVREVVILGNSRRPTSRRG